MARERNAIIIAPWGFPPQWRKAKYKFKFNRKGIKISETECHACNSTLVLAARLQESGIVNIEKIIVIGLDSVIAPSEQTNSNHRKFVKEWFSKVIDKLIEKCDCCKKLEKSLFEIVIAPGIGNYYGYSFEGTANHIFITTYSAILKVLKGNQEEVRHRDIFLDITHGINYQVTAVLYATIAALLSYNPKEKVEDRLYIVNSEPYPTGYRSEGCVERVKISQIEGMPEMEILDFTELHNAIRALRAITSMIKLDERPLKDYIKTLGGEILDSEIGEIRDKLNELVKFFKLLRLGLAGLVYPCNNFSMNVGQVNKDIEDLYQQYSQILRKEYLPKINFEAKKVSYDKVNMYVVIVEMLDQIRKLIIQPLVNANNLIDFKNALKRIYRASDMKNNELLVERELSEFNRLLKILKQEFPSQNNVWKKKQVEIIWSAIKGMRYQEERRESQEVGEAQLRNFMAHVGLKHEVIEEIKIQNNKITINFDNSLLRKYIKEIFH